MTIKVVLFTKIATSVLAFILDNICTECICKTSNTYCLRIPCANQLERNNFEFGDAHCVFNCNDPDDPSKFSILNCKLPVLVPFVINS